MNDTLGLTSQAGEKSGFDVKAVIAGGTAATTLAVGVGSAAAAGNGEGAVRGAGQALSRRGGLAGNDVSDVVSSTDVSFLQSPGDGQLMVVPTDTASALDSAKVSAAMVEGQMNGTNVSTSLAGSLQESGYAVYSRGWGDWVGEFVQVASRTVS